MWNNYTLIFHMMVVYRLLIHFYMIALWYLLYKLNYEIKGTAMGSTMAHNYANLYVGNFEHAFIFNHVIICFLPNIYRWHCYIDDIFLMWCGSENALFEFQQFFNHSSEHLKFTIDYEECQVNFPGSLIIKDNDKLVTDLNWKPTDRNTVLHGQSFHPTFKEKSSE